MIEAGEIRDDKKSMKAEIAEVEARLLQRWADTRIHASVVGENLRDKLTSPYTLIGAAGVGFGIAWYYQQREPRPEPRPEPRRTERSEPEHGASMMTNLLNGLNLAGMVISMFPTNATSGGGETENDPR